MATTHKYVQTSKSVSFGCELEFIDWPRNEPLMLGMAIDEGAYTNVNSNGVAVDGPGKLYHLGGEILTAPSEEVSGPSDQMDWAKTKWPEMTHNYRTGLNVHVRIPGLRDDVNKLKRVQTFAHKVLPSLLSVIDPIPKPTSTQYSAPAALDGAQKNYKTRLMDHHTLLSEERLLLQMKARTPKEFFEAEAIHQGTGKVHWALHARTCVNLRQLMQTDTVEFRHFFMPYTAQELLNSVLWCKLFLEVALDGGSLTAKQLLNEFGWEQKSKSWPKPLPYVYWLDRGYYFTSRRYHTPSVVLANIQDWLTREKPPAIEG